MALDWTTLKFSRLQKIRFPKPDAKNPQKVVAPVLFFSPAAEVICAIALPVQSLTVATSFTLTYTSNIPRENSGFA
ncbi:MAG: hypothetical protein EOP05_05125 [Proteobacteria bacterium]|nr:MAG: hypothetical protein EOP05_05125 [Pseudomonadota bacterium]